MRKRVRSLLLHTVEGGQVPRPCGTGTIFACWPDRRGARRRCVLPTAFSGPGLGLFRKAGEQLPDLVDQTALFGGGFNFHREIPVWRQKQVLKGGSATLEFEPAPVRLATLRRRFENDSDRIRTLLTALFCDRPWSIVGFGNSESDRLGLIELLTLLLPCRFGLS